MERRAAVIGLVLCSVLRNQSIGRAFLWLGASYCYPRYPWNCAIDECLLPRLELIYSPSCCDSAPIMESTSQKSPSRASRTSLRSSNQNQNQNQGASSQLRRRQGGPRASAPNLADDAASPPAPKLRRSSTLSDTVSEARYSIKSSTDGLFLPRADSRGGGPRDENHESAWQSTPLALALLPALAGVFFHNGTAVFTDLTLLVLAAIFLNWSLRLPW